MSHGGRGMVLSGGGAVLLTSSPLLADAVSGTSDPGVELVGPVPVLIAVVLFTVICFGRVVWHWLRPAESSERMADLLREATARAGQDLARDPDLVALRDTLVQTLSSLSGVAFAAVLTAPGFARNKRLARNSTHAGQSDHCCLILTAGQPSARRYDLPAAAAVFFGLTARTAERVLHRHGRQALLRSGLPEGCLGDAESWLAAPVAGPDGVQWVVLLGLRATAVHLASLQTLLEQQSDRLALLLTVRRHLVTLRGELAARRAQSDALSRLNKMQGEFVAVASHELKTPLTSISAYTEALLQHADQSRFPQTGEFLGIVKEEAERLLRMVDRILDFSQLEFGQRLLATRVLPLGPLIGETIRSLEPLLARKGLQLVLDCPADQPRVEVDADLIKQALINLVNNAIKYTPGGGTVTVSTREDAATMRVTISDTGPGIPADELRSIFRQFYRIGGPAATTEGAGLGLAIVKNIINLHDGHVDVQSHEGAGAAFSFHLPKEHHYNPVASGPFGDLASRPYYRQIIRLCVRMTAEMMESRRVAVLLLDDRKQSLAVHAALGYSAEWVRRTRLDRNDGIAGEILAASKPALGRIAADEPLAGAASVPGEEAALAAVPLRIAGETVGLVVVCQKLQAEAYGQDDLNLLATLSAKIGAALEAARRGGSSARQLTKIVDALQTLAMLKQSAIPTATPLALRLLARTAARLGLSRAEVKRLQYVASLHDAGMARINEDILLKTGLLSEEEREEVSQHPERGAQLMEPLLPMPEMGEIILAHHERVDGSGYPEGRQGGDIPLGARVLAVVDAFFAMIRNRPFRAGRPAEEVVAEIRSHAGTQFDPVVVDTFLAVLQEEGVLARTALPSVAAGGQKAINRREKEQTWQPQGS